MDLRPFLDPSLVTSIDVGDFERHGFGDAQPGAETDHQHGAILEAGDVLEQAANLVGADEIEPLSAKNGLYLA